MAEGDRGEPSWDSPPRGRGRYLGATLGRGAPLPAGQVRLQDADEAGEDVVQDGGAHEQPHIAEADGGRQRAAGGDLGQRPEEAAVGVDLPPGLADLPPGPRVQLLPRVVAQDVAQAPQRRHRRPAGPVRRAVQRPAGPPQERRHAVLHLAAQLQGQPLLGIGQQRPHLAPQRGAGDWAVRRAGRRHGRAALPGLRGPRGRARGCAAETVPARRGWGLLQAGRVGPGAAAEAGYPRGQPRALRRPRGSRLPPEGPGPVVAARGCRYLSRTCTRSVAARSWRGGSRRLLFALLLVAFFRTGFRR